MTEQQKENLLLSINKILQNYVKKFDEQDKNIETILEKIENRDNLLISITKEFALLRNDWNQKLENSDKEFEFVKQNFKDINQKLERQRQDIARLELALLDKIATQFDEREVNNDKL